MGRERGVTGAAGEWEKKKMMGMGGPQRARSFFFPHSQFSACARLSPPPPSSHRPHMDPAAAASPLSILETEKARLENAVAKLKDSNAELKAALASADPADAGELRAALNENMPIIAKYIARAVALGEEINRCKRAAEAGCEGGGEVAGASEPERVETGGEAEGAGPGAAGPAAHEPGPPGAADGVWL